MDKTPSAKLLIEKLIASGMNQTDIAKALQANGIEITQATINRLKQGKAKTTRFEVGIGLMRLANSRAKPTKRGDIALPA